MTTNEMREAASKLLEVRPMKAKEIAATLGLKDGRSLSMALQYDIKFINDGRRWKLTGKRY